MHASAALQMLLQLYTALLRPSCSLLHIYQPPSHPLYLMQVVVSTCNGSGEARLEDQQFRIVVLDEASQVGWEVVQAVGSCWRLSVCRLASTALCN